MSRRHETIEIADDIVMPHDDMIIDEVEVTDRRITWNHAVVLNDVSLTHLERIFIYKKQWRVNQVGESDIGIVDAILVEQLLQRERGELIN